MKYLLTSGGISNTSIHNTLEELLGKSIAESSALYVPTAIYANPNGTSMSAKVIRGEVGHPFCSAGWKSLGLLELTALPSINRDNWAPLLKETDALLVGGGDPLYLSYWMRQSGLADLLPSLGKTVYVGLSAGSMVLAPRVGEDFVRWRPSTGGDETLGMVDFAIFPHLDHEMMPDNNLVTAEKWAAEVRVLGYAIDDDTAIKVVDGAIEVISEGHWTLFAPEAEGGDRQP